MTLRIISTSHPSELIGYNLLQHNLLNNIVFTLVDFRSATLYTKHSGALAHKDQVRPLFTVRALRQRHGALPYLPDILFVS